MASSSPIAKVSFPTPSGYFARHRLYRLLDKSRNSPLLWITGPPGCGKTALVSSYIASRRVPCIWYKVDEADADLSTFFYYLGLAVSRAAPRRKKRLPLLTPERMPGVAVFAQRYFESLSELLPVPFLLVLDDCHRMQENLLFFETLREGLSRLATGIHTVFVSRSDPHSCFARERANRLLATVGWEELRLTLPEATGIVKLQRKGRPAPELVRDLFERTDGWAAGLVLLLERTDTGRIAPRTIGQQVPAELIDYFGSEVFRRLDNERRHFLMQTAFLPRMTGSMAERLTGVAEAGSILSEMNRHNQFTKKYLEREAVYEYHDLFREFLLERASDAYAREQLSQIRQAAGGLLEESGYAEDAAVLYREGRDWEALSRLILSRAGSLVGQGRYQTVLEWLGALPEEVMENDPWLLYWKGVCLLPFAPAESTSRFEDALRKFDARREAPGVFLAWSGAVESIVTPMDNLKPADTWIALLPRLLEKYGGLPSGEIGEEVTCSMYRALSWRQYPRADVELWTSRAISVARTTTDTRRKFILNLGFLTSFLITKDTREAGSLFASLRENLKKPDAAPLMRLSVDMLDAVFLLVIARPEVCRDVTTGGLNFADDLGVHIADSFLEAYSAMASLKMHDFETASRFLNRLSATVDTMKPLPTGLYHLITGCHELFRREFLRAAFHSRECLRLLVDCGFTTHLPSAYILAAHVHHALHEDEDAVKHMEEARRIGYEILNYLGVYLSYLTEAYFCLERDSRAAAIAPMRKGFQILRENGMYGTLLWLPDMFGKVSVAALEEGIEVDYVREFIRRNGLMPDPANPDLEQWPWPVKVYTLGRFGLLVDDHPVEFGRKVQQRPLSLLKAVIALGGRDVSETRITELLWPEADGDLAHHSFTVALSRLRKLLGKEEALVLKEGQVSLSNRHCWVDVWAFERSLGQAEKAKREEKGTEVFRYFEKGLSLYGGSFLPSEEMTWAVSLREKLRSRFLAEIAHLGRHYEETGRWEEAVSCYGRGLDADDLAEELYRRLMICHIRRGREAEALSVYRRCRKTLSSILSVDPSAETQAIAASLGRSTVRSS